VNSPKGISGGGSHWKVVHNDGVSTSSFGDGGASSGGAPALGNLSTVPAGPGEAPSGDVVAWEVAQRWGISECWQRMVVARFEDSKGSPGHGFYKGIIRRADRVLLTDSISNLSFKSTILVRIREGDNLIWFWFQALCPG
jgi:hypothetical protein